MRLVLLREIPPDASLRQQWDALVMRASRPQVFYTYEWALAVQRAYGDTVRPWLFLAYDEQDAICGIAALARGIAGGQVSFLSATTADYCDFLSQPEDKPAFVAAVLAELRKQGIGDIALANLPADSDTCSALREAGERQGYHLFTRTAYTCALIFLGQLERGKDGKRVAPGQKRIRRFAKAMVSEGPICFDHSRSWEDVAPILPEFIQAHVARFLEIGRISNLANPRRKIFLGELAKLLSERQWLVLSRMAAGKRVVAWHYGFQFHDTWFWYQPTFDSSVEKHWPGFCLLTGAIQEATENPSLTTLDLGLGSEAYKSKFANGARETLHVSLHRSGMSHWQEVGRYRIAEAARSLPALEKSLRSLRESIRGFRRRLRSDGVRPVLALGARRLVRVAWVRDEVVFCQWEGLGLQSTPDRGLQIQALSLSHLALAAMEYEDDPATLGYLLRTTRRLRTSGMEGYVLLRDDGRPVHFAWTAPFDGFHCAELSSALEGTPDTVLLFDCWTPTVVRGQGNCRTAIALIAERIKAGGKQPWILSPASNAAAVPGLAKAGFQPRYSLVREGMLGWGRITSKTGRRNAMRHPEASAPV